jgi:hypothetical protein
MRLRQHGVHMALMWGDIIVLCGSLFSICVLRSFYRDGCPHALARTIIDWILCLINSKCQKRKKLAGNLNDDLSVPGIPSDKFGQ